MEKQQIKNRLTKLRQKMAGQEIGIYIIPMNDFHGSEYIGDYFKLIAYFSGFTGSAGTLLVTEEEAYLWTDGRYFLQAEKQLDATGIVLQKMGEKDIPTVTEFITSYMQKQENNTKAVGFDGRLIRAAFVEKLKGLRIVSDVDFAGEIWNDDTENRRPDFPDAPVWILDEKFSGENTGEKLTKVREDMEKKQADYLLLTTLDDIAYLTNLRGGDIAYNSVFLSYMIVTKTQAMLYSHIREREIEDYLEKYGITVCDYVAFYKEIAKLPERSRVWFDDEAVSFRVTDLLPKGCEKLTGANPVMLRKAVKNETEVRNIRLAHVKDGIAVTKFIYWLKQEVAGGKEAVTEVEAAAKLMSLRSQQADYLGESFSPIIAHGKHGAIVHYNAEDGGNAPIGQESFLLCDTGAHYLQGTTDITRTIAMGKLTAEQKKHYTAVLVGNLRLTDVIFKYGLTGANLDYVARQPLYRLGLDFNHGTGHGVGYLLNVHEGPNAFRMRAGSEGVFEVGMITSNEPGFYSEGRYGIRLENLIVCVNKQETEYGRFLGFEPLTMVPFDREAIDEQMMTPEDKRLLNDYHKQVYEAVSDALTGEEKKWLLEVTRPL